MIHKHPTYTNGPVPFPDPAATYTKHRGWMQRPRGLCRIGWTEKPNLGKYWDMLSRASEGSLVVLCWSRVQRRDLT